MRKTCLILYLILMPFVLMSQTASLEFSHSGGFYESSFDLTLTCESGNHIRYTTNGTAPTSSSALYTEPLTMNADLYSKSDIYTIQISPDNLVYVPDSVSHCIVIRAAVFDANEICVSETKTNTYFINSLGCETSGMAVVSVCADSLDLFDYETGIFVPGVNWDSINPDHTGNYYQHGDEWERLVNVEFYEPSDNSGINQKCGLRTHGNRSRRYPSKGMKIYAREEYGKKRFEHAFFENNPMNSFKHLVLKPFASFWPYSGAQDYFCNKLAIQVGLPTSDSRPVIVYLNGEYWGVYFLQEKMDERFLEDHYGVIIDNCNIIGDWRGNVDHGTNVSFRYMMNWFEESNLADDEVYRHACELIDINNFIDYYVFQTFVGNWDWPGNNMRCWQEGNGPWRWIFFDGDATIFPHDFNVFENAAIYNAPPTWIEYPEAKLVFRKLLDNTQFKNAFIARIHELCDGPFQYEHTFPIFNGIIETLRPEIEEQRHRFGYPTSMDTWINGNATINAFLTDRVEKYYEEMDAFPLLGIDEFAFADGHFICFPNPAKDEVRILLFATSQENVELNIYDITGRLVHNETMCADFGETVLSIKPNLPSGIYFIKIGNSTQKIIIQ